ncbi:MAG TPA: serine/threonine protein kinase, partial [Thermoleophilia bacterium]|nr:serine/threonine protein kinase [Thermoleophilia bacterium]
LLPEATVYNARKQQLGKGSLLTLELPSGTHLLVIVGPDGEERSLSVPVRPGKNAPLKMRVADLPLRER